MVMFPIAMGLSQDLSRESIGSKRFQSHENSIPDEVLTQDMDGDEACLAG